MTSFAWGSVLLRLLGRRDPHLRGRLSVAGADAPIVIRRDRWGIPHVRAESDADAWFGLGFCHAQDRAFQLEANLRAARGTLAATFGPATLGFDRLARRLGFARVADAQLPLLAPEVREVIVAYVAGINAGLGSGRRRPPHELALVRAASTPWRAEDPLAFGALMSFSLAGNWDIELARLKIATEDGPQALIAVDGDLPDHPPPAALLGSGTAPRLGRLARDIEAFRAAAGGGGGSNAWALSGDRTDSGRPLLAGDPHLPPVLPPQWYLAHLATPDWELAGATMPGAPTFPVGHNGFAAWTITAALTDASDLFVERLAPEGRSVAGATGWVDCEVIEEPIEVRGERTRIEEVLITPRGPLVSPVLDEVPHALSLSAVWLRALPVRGLLDIASARSFEAFRSAFSEWPGPALTVAYADRDGHIAWQLIGQLPRRRSGFGTFPRAGWEPDSGWDGLVPFDEMPYELDPPTGWLATANDAPRRPEGDEAPLLGADWLEGYRAQRISEALVGEARWGVTSCQRLQLDVESVPWREVRDAVLAIRPPHGTAAAALDLLRGWDGRATADSPAAAVYELLMSELAARILRDRLPRSWRWALGAGFGESLPRTLLASRSVSRVVSALRERGPERRQVLIGAALEATAARLATEHGPDPLGWAWGRVRPLTLRHPFGRQSGFGPALNIGPLPWGGDSNTPAQAGVRPLDPLGNPGVVANTRAVFDLADLEASRFALAGGQSGNPLSRHYRDLFKLWRRGAGVPILLARERIEDATIDTLRLDPA